MDRIYKSSTGVLLGKFISDFGTALLTAALVFIVGMMGIDPANQSARLALFIGCVAAALVLALFTSFGRSNVTVSVTPEAVNLYRGQKLYASLSREDYEFTSYIKKIRYLFFTFTSRYLAVTPRHTGHSAPVQAKTLKGSKTKLYRVCLGPSDYAELISAITQ